MKMKMKIDEVLGEQFEDYENWKSDKFSSHGYESFYKGRLERRGKFNLLEIGIAAGGSMMAWKELCPEARLCGVDLINSIFPTVSESFKEEKKEKEEKTRVLFGDAYELRARDAVVDVFPEGIDILIDDGPHTFSSWVAFMVLYVPLVRPGGLIVIEDVYSRDVFDELDKVSIYPLKMKEFNPDILDDRIIFAEVPDGV